MKNIHEEAGVMSLGLVALAAFLVVGALAAFLGRNANANAMRFRGTDPAPTDSGARPVQTGSLPAIITESSGIARSRRSADVWWTHNDGRDGRVFAITPEGTLLGTWRVDGVRTTDVEDIAAAACPGESEPCLYLADTGDNNRNRDEYAILVVREPETSARAADGVVQPIAVLRFTYGGPPRDAEALAVLDDGSILVITKGQDVGAEVFSLPPIGTPARDAPAITAQSLGVLGIDTERKASRVTAAAVSPSGSRLAVRSDIDITMFTLPDRRLLTHCPVEGLGEQGEAVDFVDETTLMVTFERGPTGQAPIGRVRCGTDQAPAAGLAPSSHATGASRVWFHASAPPPSVHNVPGAGAPAHHAPSRRVGTRRS